MAEKIDSKSARPTEAPAGKTGKPDDTKGDLSDRSEDSGGISQRGLNEANPGGSRISARAVAKPEGKTSADPDARPAKEASVNDAPGERAPGKEWSAATVSQSGLSARAATARPGGGKQENAGLPGNRSSDDEAARKQSSDGEGQSTKSESEGHETDPPKQ